MSTKAPNARILDGKMGWKFRPLPGEDKARGAYLLENQRAERAVRGGAVVRLLRVTATRWALVLDDEGTMALVPESALEFGTAV